VEGNASRVGELSVKWAGSCSAVEVASGDIDVGSASGGELYHTEPDTGRKTPPSSPVVKP